MARRRVERLTELLRVEATSRRSWSRARATLSEPRGAARLGAGRRGAGDETRAEARTRPRPSRSGPRGRAAWPRSRCLPARPSAAGTPLGRLVRVRPLWIVAALRPEEATRVQASPQGPLSQATGPAGARRDRGGEREARLAIARGGSADGVRRRHPRGRPQRFRAAARQRRRGGGPAPRRGARHRRAALGRSRRLRARASRTSSSTARASRAVRCASCGRLGNEALVDGLRPGERLVTQGAGAVRRSSLLSAGAPEGHVH